MRNLRMLTALLTDGVALIDKAVLFVSFGLNWCTPAWGRSNPSIILVSFANLFWIHDVFCAAAYTQMA